MADVESFLHMLSLPDTPYAATTPERLLHSLANYLTSPYPRLPIPLYTHALTLSPPPDRRTWYIRQLRILVSQTTDPAPPYTLEERRVITDFTRVYPELWSIFLTSPVETLKTLSIPLAPHPTELGQPLWVPTAQPLTWTRLPRLFSWLVPGRLAISSTPRTAADIRTFHNLGITLVLTLTAEQPLPAAWFARVGTRNLFLPAPNHHPPTRLQTDRILRLIHAEPGRVLVHCGGGKGRAGTVAACYLALYGHGAETRGEAPQRAARDAVRELRRLRPGSVETRQQEEFVRRYVTRAWARYGRGERLCGEEVGEPRGVLECVGEAREVEVVVLSGVPGSGKSAFARMVGVRREVTVVSGDEVVAEGSGARVRAACEAVVGRWRRGRVLVVDRCNPTPEQRRAWVKLLLEGARVFAVHFDIAQEVCIQRAEARAEHPTLPPWRVRTAVESISKQLVPPSMEEGYFAGVAVVHSADNARELADKLFGAVPLLKFPRTHHLLNLGSATREDLILPASTLEHLVASRTPVAVEEKIDGANLGFSLSSEHSILVQNRSHYVTAASHAQFTRLPGWLAEKGAAVREILMHHRDDATPERFVLYGEWMAAQHSAAYTALPDWFVAFDMYDRLQRRFLSRRELEEVLEGTGISLVPLIYSGLLEGEEQLLGMLEERSAYSEERREGVVVKWGVGEGERGKVVRSDFIAGDENWSKGRLRKNQLKSRQG